MKKYWHIALMLFCVLMITSCGDDDEALDGRWFCYSVTEYAPRRSLGDLDSSTDGIRFGWKECFGKCHNKALYDFDL